MKRTSNPSPVVGFDVTNTPALLIITSSCDTLLFISLTSPRKSAKRLKSAHSVDTFNEPSWPSCSGLAYSSISICFTLCSLSALRPCNRIWCPFCASILAVSRPIPSVAPVIKIVFMRLLLGNWLMPGLTQCE